MCVYATPTRIYIYVGLPLIPHLIPSQTSLFDSTRFEYPLISGLFSFRYLHDIIIITVSDKKSARRGLSLCLTV